MYIENELNKSWKWILGIASAMLLLPQLAMPELTSSEALYGMMARNAHETGDLFSTIAQGQEVRQGHLFPWLVNFFGIFGVNEFTIRLPSILGLAIMIIGAAYVTYRYGSRQSAIVAGICMLSSYAAVMMGTRGEENMFGSAFLSMAWLCWFEMSRNQKHWLKAWLYSLSLVSVAAFSLGYYVFFLFYIPLFFLRKPTDVRKRIFLLPHLKAMLIIICLHFLIFTIVTNIDSNTTPEFGLALGETDDYTSGLFNFPFSAAIFLLPWTFFSWPPFCASFVSIEKDHILFHFLRTVTVSLFITFWILPDSSPLSLLPVLPGLAIMTGLHYQILIRRYHMHIRKLIRFILGFLVTINAGLLIFFGLKLSGMGADNISEIVLTKEWIFINIAICCAAILLSMYLLIKGRNYSVWLKIMCMSVMGHWCIITYNSIPFEGNITNEEIGNQLAVQIPGNSTVFNLSKKKHFPVMFYMAGAAEVDNTPAYREIIHQLKPLNAETDKLPNVVYVIGAGKAPLSLTNNPADYRWTKISELLQGKNGFFQAWKGIKDEP